MKENIKETSQIVLLLHLCTLASGLVINFLQYFKGTRVCSKTNSHSRVEQKRYETRVGELSREHYPQGISPE